MTNVKVRLLPFKSIGGVGNPGDEVWMSREDADMYIRDGYVEEVPGATFQVLGEAEDSEQKAAEDHAVMKPKPKRSKAVRRSK